MPSKSSSKPKQQAQPATDAPAKPSKPPPTRRANILKNGNATSSASSKVTLSNEAQQQRPPPLFPIGFKTPMSLLSERCQKSGWDKPTVEPKKLPSGKYSAAVILHRKNPKTREPESVYMRPPASPSPQAVEKDGAMEAKHYAAVYAMYRFSNNLRLHMQLPPGPREYWQVLEKEKTASPPNKAYLWSLTPFETAAAAAETLAAKNTAGESVGRPGSAPSSRSGSVVPSRASTPSGPPPPLPKVWQDAPEVRMPSALRDLVEETIKSLAGYDNVDEVDDDFVLSDSESSVLEQFVNQGFRRGHVLAAVKRLRRETPASLLHQEVLSMLHLHVPEEDLPASYRQSKPADATARIATSQDSDALGKLWKAERVAKEFGVPVSFVEDVMRVDEVGGDEARAVDVLLRRLCGWNEVGGQGDVGLREETLIKFWSAEGSDDAELESRRQDELMALEGIFGNQFRRTEDGFEIFVNGIVSLRVLLHAGSRYPSPATTSLHLPSFYVRAPTLPAYIRLYLTQLAAQQFEQDEWLELVRAGLGGLVGEMVAFLVDNAAHYVDHPPEPRHVMRYLEPVRVRETTSLASSAVVSRSNVRGPRRHRVATAHDHEVLLNHWLGISKEPAFENMTRVRQKLPAWSMRDALVKLVKDSRVVIVSGETGSGKTTQVPRFILEDAITSGQGASVNIVVTQPRRVSAIGVATRVAAEMLEDVNDESSRKLVGYAIRGERKSSRECRMLFCTTGVVLSRLSRGGDPDLEGVSHVFVDEVHERSVDSDFLLLELRDILRRNPNIKVVLMSATINQQQFSDYFGGAPCIEIPGFTHPVQDSYLEDFISQLDYAPTGLRPASKASQAELDDMRQSFVHRGVTNERSLVSLEALTRADRIDFGLVGATVAHCLEESSDVGGDVLVFMTGVLEIRQAVEAIEAAVRGLQAVQVLPLHANLTSQEQMRVFRPTAAGHRKVVVATNVAETSITIDGIVYVVDCGRVKENKFDPDTSVTRLVEGWTNKASARQRRGRAGRTRPGKCFKLFTHWTEHRFMADHPTPEMLRTPLESLCLQIKSVRADEDVRAFLSKAISPPDVRAIESAWSTLKLLGAVKEGGMNARLTPLGMHLAMLPVDVRLGKMLVLAAVFRCLEPVLTIAAILSSKPLFLNPIDKRDEAKSARAKFYTSRSDLLSDWQAFEACVQARKDGSLRSYAEEHFISLSTFRDVVQLRYEYKTALHDVGLVVGPDENVDNHNLLKAIVFAGTARLVRVRLPQAVYDVGSSGAIQRDRDAREVRFFEDARVFLHPTSLLFHETKFSTPFVTYFSKQVTSKPFLRDATEVPLYGVLLFGGKVNVDLQRGIDVGGVKMRAWPRIGVLVNGLRQLLDQDLEQRVDGRHGGSAVVEVMLRLLDRDGGV
ncbi:hypothetical protein ACM66B_001677 [Microbotryomycetes sp. NB124-2]